MKETGMMGQDTMISIEECMNRVNDSRMDAYDMMRKAENMRAKDLWEARFYQLSDQFDGIRLMLEAIGYRPFYSVEAGCRYIIVKEAQA